MLGIVVSDKANYRKQFVITININFSPSPFLYLILNHFKVDPPSPVNI